jgi:hypothetical protein
MVRENTHSIEVVRHFEARSEAVFDRVAYAMQLLAILRPRLSVAVYPRNRNLDVQRGVVPGTGEGWAMVGVPPHASREGIAQALVELSDLQDSSFLLDLLCTTRRIAAE